MNLNNNSHYQADLSKYWTELDRRVLKVINDKIIAYKSEIEYTLETEGFGSRDIGISLRWLSKEAPVNYITYKKVEIENTPYYFYYFKKKKKVDVETILNKKIEIARIYKKKAERFGTFIHNEFYPRIFNNLGFIVENISTREYNTIKLTTDLDIVLTYIENCHLKIIVDIKNRLKIYDNEDLSSFFSNLRKFDMEIIPIVIARKIYEDPKQRILTHKGNYIEMEKVLIQKEFEDISKDFNGNIANKTRIIPDQLIPKDIIKKFKEIKNLNEGLNFKKLYNNMTNLW